MCAFECQNLLFLSDEKFWSIGQNRGFLTDWLNFCFKWKMNMPSSWEKMVLHVQTYFESSREFRSWLSRSIRIFLIFEGLYSLRNFSKHINHPISFVALAETNPKRHQTLQSDSCIKNYHQKTWNFEVKSRIIFNIWFFSTWNLQAWFF